MIEWTIKGVLGVLVGGIGFYVKRLYGRMDKLEDDLTNHRVEDARNYITRKEHSEELVHLRNDIRGMISPIRESVQSIEKFLRGEKQ